MSDVSYNLYDDDENVITDDSSEAQEIDDLMNVAVTSLSRSKAEPVKQLHPKSKSIKKSIEKQRRRIKKKYIGWLNKKHRRERIGNYFVRGYQGGKLKTKPQKKDAFNETKGTDVGGECAEHRAKENTAVKNVSNILTETIDLDDSDIEDEDHVADINDHEDDDDDEDDDEEEDEDIDMNEEGNENDRKNEKEIEIKMELRTEAETATVVTTKTEIKENANENSQKENDLKAKQNLNDIEKVHDGEKDAASTSGPNTLETSFSQNIPPVSKDSPTNNINETKQDPNKNIFFSDELNRMYPKFDEIISEHVHSLNTIQSIEKKISLITSDVQSLNRQIEVKENEYNKLLYEKRVKEEILIRMVRKLKLLGMKKTQIKGKKYDLMALREIKDAITKYTSDPATKQKEIKDMTAGELLKTRAKMTRKEIEIERNFWSPVETILKNLYPEEGGTFKDTTKPLPNTLETQQNSKTSQYSENNNGIKPNRRLSGPVQLSEDLTRDNYGEHSHIRNGRLLNQMMYQQDDSKDSSDMELDVTPYTSTLEKLLTNSLLTQSSSQSKKNFSRKTDTHKLLNEREYSEDIAVVPAFQGTEFIPESTSQRDQLVVRLESSAIKLCQHCGIHEARFLCAACQNQWYCSRSCQVNAWKNHCESCE